MQGASSKMKNKFNMLSYFRKKLGPQFLSRLMKRLEMKYSRFKKIKMLSYSPEYLGIDVTNYCDLKCIMCPQSQWNETVKRGYMDFEFYKKIVDDGVDNRIETFLFGIFGEPLLHQKIIEMIRYAKSRNRRTIMTTNATLLDQRISKELLNSGLDQIHLSFDTVDKKAFENVRIGASYDKILTNILNFLELKKKKKTVFPLVTMHNMKPFDSRRPIPSIDSEFLNMFSKYNVVIQAKYFDNQGNIHKKYKKDIFTPPNKKNSNYMPCHHVYQALIICWDGVVVSCCVDFLRKCVVGDLSNQGIKEVWNSDRFLKLRESLLFRDTPKMELCNECSILWK